MDVPKSHWVEFYGGPHDGLMTELPWAFIPGTQNMGVAVNGPDTYLGDDWYRPGPRQGVYQAAFWADEELGIVRMDCLPATATSRS